MNDHLMLTLQTWRKNLQNKPKLTKLGKNDLILYFNHNKSFIAHILVPILNMNFGDIKSTDLFSTFPSLPCPSLPSLSLPFPFHSFFFISLLFPFLFLPALSLPSFLPSFPSLHFILLSFLPSFIPSFSLPPLLIPYLPPFPTF